MYIIKCKVYTINKVNSLNNKQTNCNKSKHYSFLENISTHEVI